MKLLATILDPLPLYRLAVASSLSGLGVEVETGDVVQTWRRDADVALLILSLCGPEEWKLLTELQMSRPDLPVLALIEAVSVDSYTHAVRRGAVSVIPRSATPEDLQSCVGSLVKGMTALPVAVVRALVIGAGIDTGPGVTRPSSQELAWLRQLADGATVAELAESAGYSERMMFRRLRRLYEKVPARNRTEALMMVRDRGWI